MMLNFSSLSDEQVKIQALSHPFNASIVTSTILKADNSGDIRHSTIGSEKARYEYTIFSMTHLLVIQHADVV